MVVLLKRVLMARPDFSLAHPRGRFDIRRATILAATGLSTTVVEQKTRISADKRRWFGIIPGGTLIFGKAGLARSWLRRLQCT